MLFGELGQQLGMLSGGCLEADLQTRARRVLQTGREETVSYDTLAETATDSTDMPAPAIPQLGCGGIVDIVLQLPTANNQYLGLEALYQQLEGGNTGTLPLSVNEQPALNTTIKPPPALWVAGGGRDAIPLVELAKQLGWRVYLSDPRPANARRELFSGAEVIERELLKPELPPAQLPGWLKDIDAAVVMTHNVSLDAKALQLLCGTRIRYCGLLGPQHRKQEVLELAELDEAALPAKLHGPAGFNIGGELPESIALSILAQCHQAIYRREQNPND